MDNTVFQVSLLFYIILQIKGITEVCEGFYYFFLLFTTFINFRLIKVNERKLYVGRDTVSYYPKH